VHAATANPTTTSYTDPATNHQKIAGCGVGMWWCTHQQRPISPLPMMATFFPFETTAEAAAAGAVGLTTVAA
jgi:hypothetical protein